MLGEAAEIINAAKGETISLSAVFLIVTFVFMGVMHLRNKGAVAPKADVQMTLVTYNQIMQKMDGHDKDITKLKEDVAFIKGRAGIGHSDPG